VVIVKGKGKVPVDDKGKAPMDPAGSSEPQLGIDGSRRPLS
jgi:hypothetical protein